MAPELVDRGPDELTGLVADVNSMAQAIQARDAEKESLVAAAVRCQRGNGERDRHAKAMGSHAAGTEDVLRCADPEFRGRNIRARGRSSRGPMEQGLRTADRRSCLGHGGHRPTSGNLSTAPRRTTLADVVLDGANRRSGRALRQLFAVDTERQCASCRRLVRKPERERALCHIRRRTDLRRHRRMLRCHRDASGRDRAKEGGGCTSQRAKQSSGRSSKPSRNALRLVATDGRILEINRAGLEMLQADSLEQVVRAVHAVLHCAGTSARSRRASSTAYRGETGDPSPSRSSG